MIEGLQVKVVGQELRELCETRSKYHSERALVYEQQAKAMEEAKIEGANVSGGDPVQNLKSKMESHLAEADEMKFIAAHIDINECYLLGREDLYKLGIVKSKY